MADNYIEKKQEEYEAKKRAWEQRSRLRDLKRRVEQRRNNASGSTDGSGFSEKSV